MITTKNLSKISLIAFLVLFGGIVFASNIAILQQEPTSASLIADQDTQIENGDLIITEDGKQRTVPSWLSILPPLIAILFALIFREVIVSLFMGVISGVLIIKGFSFNSIIEAFVTVFDKYVLNALIDPDHVAVILFSMLIGGMVAIISKNGGMRGVINKLSKYADSPRSGQMITWFLGILIFFDDYANTLVVGNTMRPVTDKLKISREKLSYIVDSTAAPIAAIAFTTTWIGAELGFIQQSLEFINADSTSASINQNAYTVFLHSLKYAYYPVLTLSFIFFVIILNRDFGPMYHAEVRARTTGDVVNKKHKQSKASEEELKKHEPEEGTPERWYNAVIPILGLIVVVITSLIITGSSTVNWEDPSLSFGRKLSMAVGAADSYKSLIWASAAGVFIAFVLSASQKIMDIHETVNSMLNGFKIMLPAIVILVLAWALGDITKDLNTAGFLGSALSEHINPYWLAEIVFLLAAITAFSTGTSWGTMTILYPIVLPLSWVICQSNGLPAEDSFKIFYMVTSVVLAGAVFGDHCSPISDTTILSSLATATPHIDHVRTQLPYAIVVAVVSNFLCTKLSDAGWHWTLCYLAGIVSVFLIIRFVGNKVPLRV